MKKLKYHKIWLFFGIVYIIIIFYFCLKRPTESMHSNIEHFDKVVHFTTYLIAGWWFRQIYPSQINKSLFFFLLSLGCSIEFFQYLTGYRSAELYDIVANSLGILSGIYPASYIAPRVLKRIDSNIYKKLTNKNKISLL